MVQLTHKLKLVLNSKKIMLQPALLLLLLFLHKKLLPRIPELFERIKAAGLTTSLDTNDDPEDRWQGGLRDVLFARGFDTRCAISHPPDLARYPLAIV